MKNYYLIPFAFLCCTILACEQYKVKKTKDYSIEQVDQTKVEVDLSKGNPDDSSKVSKDAANVQLNDLQKQATGAKEASDGLKKNSR